MHHEHRCDQVGGDELRLPHQTPERLGPAPAAGPREWLRIQGNGPARGNRLRFARNAAYSPCIVGQRNPTTPGIVQQNTSRSCGLHGGPRAGGPRHGRATPSVTDSSVGAGHLAWVKAMTRTLAIAIFATLLLGACAGPA